MRSPSELTDAQWRLVVDHMRVHAGLTTADAEAIARFLARAN